MTSTYKLTVEPLDARIRDVLLRRIVTGDLAPGSNLTETRLAQELGASRTPLRHALIRLEQEGFVVLEPNRGFFVAPLSSEEAHELYPILSTLEQLALREALPDRDRVRELFRRNAEYAATPPNDLEAIVAANFAWHEALLAHCTNRRLMTLIRTIREQVYRYELAFFSPGEERLAKSVELHRRILEALERGDEEEACARLDAHWAADLDSLAPEELVPEEAKEAAGRAANTKTGGRAE